MDRIIRHEKNATFSWFKEFEYLDLFPYTIALIMILGEVYILNEFVSIARHVL